MPKPPPPYDVIIAGGGPAGLSAALVLGRCRRRVLVFDSGHPRNAVSPAMHGFITRDGMNPAEFRQVARDQLATYPSVEFREAEIVNAERGEEQFTVTLKDGSTFVSRILLLATGMRDRLPPLEGLERFYGTSVHLCPYCDGWEHRDQAIAVYGEGQAGADLALEMLGWSRAVILCTNGAQADFGEACSAKLERYGIRLVETAIARLEGEGDQLRGIRFRDGEFLPCEALFFASEQEQCNELAANLGCTFCKVDGVAVEHEDTRATGVPGLYVAGNSSRGLQLVIMAAASGTLAAFNINQALLDADADKAISDLGISCDAPEQS